MSDRTKIEWCDATFNPWMGCSKVSAGCTNCYAERQMGTWLGLAPWGENGPRRRTGPTYWLKPLRWNRQAEADGRRPRVFCASLADVFEDRPELELWRADLWRLIDRTQNLDWLLLTKRPENIGRMLPHLFPHVRLGVSVEDQGAANLRLPQLFRWQAAGYFVSYEPALGQVDFTRVREEPRLPAGLVPICGGNTFDALRGQRVNDIGVGYDAPRLEQVIAGGESGPKARPSHPEWFRSVRRQCQLAQVPFFFKQWGEWASRASGVAPAKLAACRQRAFVAPSGAFGHEEILKRADGCEPVWRTGRQTASRRLDGRTWDEFPKERV